MAFLETPRFPDDISYGSQGGPGYNTSIVVIRSGAESRNVNWTYARHAYDVAYGVKTITQLSDLIDHFHACAGMAYGFRYKDFMDCKSSGNHETTVSDTDQTIGTGDNVETDFQLVKVYTRGAFSRTRNITKPVTGTTVVSLDDVGQGSGWSVDTTTGIVTFDVAPGGSVVVKAGFEFDVPVRFDTDELNINYEAYEQGAANVPLVEIRDIS
jgi:uncharacterized protein (TIGR02217 family)